MNNTIYATFSEPEMAEKATGALLDHGVRPEHLSVVFPQGYRSTNSDDVKTAQDIEDSATKGISTTTGADAASGAAKGAGIGLAAGTIAALASVFVPGFGLVLGSGALALAVGGAAGATAAGALAGGATGYLKDQGVSDEDIQMYNSVLTGGGALLTVSTSDEQITGDTIRSIVSKYNGISSTSSVVPVSGSAVVDMPSGTPTVK
jgi:hypothetical protein